MPGAKQIQKTQKVTKVQQFTRFFRPIIEVLKDSGGSGSTSEVYDLIAERLGITDEEMAEETPSGTDTRIHNNIRWARFYLMKAGYLRNSKRGVWSLTEKGLKVVLSDGDDQKILAEAKRIIEEEHGMILLEGEDHSLLARGEEVEIPVIDQEPETLLQVLQSLPATGFERICQRLLREAGFQQVTVTGRSGDGGIDGHGILEVNPLVSFKVIFQCKRYQGSVAVGVVRDFRGAMMGRADKAIIITTGTFTQDAKREAIRDGVPPIELVDGTKLVALFEHLNIGVKSRMVIDIDYNFFEEYR